MLGDGEELLVHAERDFHRPARQQRQRRRQRLELDIELGAEAAAEIGGLDAHAVLRPAQEPRDLDAHEGRALRGGMDGEPVFARLGDRHHRLQGRVRHLLGAEGVLEDMRRLGKCLLGVAAPQLEIERHIGALAAFEMLEIGKSTRRLEHVVDDGLGRNRLDLVHHRRQFIEFGHDEPRRFLGHMRVLGQDHGHRFADVPHLVDRQDRLVVEGRAVIGVGNDPADVVAGVDRKNAGTRLRRRGVDR